MLLLMVEVMSDQNVKVEIPKYEVLKDSSEDWSDEGLKHQRLVLLT